MEQRAGGSNPSAPTIKINDLNPSDLCRYFCLDSPTLGWHASRRSCEGVGWGVFAGNASYVLDGAGFGGWLPGAFCALLLRFWWLFGRGQGGVGEPGGLCAGEQLRAFGAGDGAGKGSGGRAVDGAGDEAADAEAFCSLQRFSGGLDDCSDVFIDGMRSLLSLSIVRF